MRVHYLLLCLISISLFSEDCYYSQNGQDRYLYENIFQDKRSGIFVEFGASDGIRFSNTYFFEKNFGWNGLCIEPNPNLFPILQKNRNCICLQGCISDFRGSAKFLLIQGYGVGLSGLLQKYDPAHMARIERDISTHGSKSEIIDVECFMLSDVLQKYEIFAIDYLSMDTEGGELDILKTIDFDTFFIDVISVEVNFSHDRRFQQFLSSKGYAYLGKVGADEFYRKIQSS